MRPKAQPRDLRSREPAVPDEQEKAKGGDCEVSGWTTREREQYVGARRECGHGVNVGNLPKLDGLRRCATRSTAGSGCH